MTRGRVLLTVLAALALLAGTGPESAGARSRILKVALPSVGDITVAHVSFKRSAARSRRLPRLRLASRSTRRLLRRYRVAALGGSLRVNRRRVVGAVLLMRERRGRRDAATPRGAAASVAVDGAVASTIVERNPIADARRERAAAAGEFASAPTVCGETGLFTLLSGDTLPRGAWGFSLYYNNWKSVVDFEDDRLERDEGTTLMRLSLSASCGYGITDRFEPKLQVPYEDFVESLGAGTSCLTTLTYVGPVTDSQGNVLAQPFFSTGIRCNAEIRDVTFTVPGSTPARCEDSAGHQCQIQGGSAFFPFLVTPGQDASYSISTDPPLQRGTSVMILIDTDEGDLRVAEVM